MVFPFIVEICAVIYADERKGATYEIGMEVAEVKPYGHVNMKKAG